MSLKMLKGRILRGDSSDTLGDYNDGQCSHRLMFFTDNKYDSRRSIRDEITPIYSSWGQSSAFTQGGKTAEMQHLQRDLFSLFLL